MKQFLETRENPGGAYDLFCNHFLQCVVGRRNWRAGVEAKEVRDVATMTDEALCLLLLENSWDKWVDMAVNKTGKSDVESKFTSGGIGKNSKKYMGWSRDGLKRFNTLRSQIESERRNARLVEFDAKYLANRIARLEAVKREKNNGTGNGNEGAADSDEHTNTDENANSGGAARSDGGEGSKLSDDDSSYSVNGVI
jgi:hypothetical protein